MNFKELPIESRVFKSDTRVRRELASALLHGVLGITVSVGLVLMLKLAEAL